MTARLVRFLTFLAPIAVATGGCSTGGLLGLPGPQDGTWLSTPSQFGVLGGATYILQISLDRIVRVNVNGAEWTVQQSYPASRINSDIAWKVIAAPPLGIINPLIPATNTQYDIAVTAQADGSLTGTASQGISTIPGIASIPTGSFQIVMRRI